MRLLDYVRALENKSRDERGERVLAALREMGVAPVVQACRLLEIRNISVDFSPSINTKRPLFCAHYDAVKGTPGANDNASGVAVLLGLCRWLQDAGFPARVVFFDREEAWLRTPLVKPGLLGSHYYAWTHSLRHISAVYNLEYCGRGDFLGIWPVKKKQSNLPAVNTIEKAATRLSLPCQTAHIPWPLFSSDHFSFRLRGLRNAVTLSLLPADQAAAAQSVLKGMSLRTILVRRSVLLQPFLDLHTSRDTADRLSEDSLQLMLSLVRELAKEAS